MIFIHMIGTLSVRITPGTQRQQRQKRWRPSKTLLVGGTYLSSPHMGVPPPPAPFPPRERGGRTKGGRTIVLFF